MRKRTWMGMLVLLAAAATPVWAQQAGMGMHEPGQQGGMMQMCPGMMSGGGMSAGHPMMGSQGAAQGMPGHSGMTGAGGMQGMMHGSGGGAAALLGAAEELGLTAEQKARLQELAAATREDHREHMQAAMSAHGGAAEFLDADTPDLQAYEQALVEASDHMVQAHVGAARASIEARAVLTEEQRAKADEILPVAGAMACGMMGAGRDGPGDGDGGHAQHHR